LATPARAARGPIVGLPESLESLFKGREHLLTELHRALRGQRDVALQSASPRAGHVAGHGGGGIGKTRLAIEYAWRHRDDYPGGIFFVVAARRDPLAIWAELARRAPQLFPGDLTRDEEAAVAFARWLSDPAQGAKLIVLDDVQAESSKELFVRFGKREVSGQGIWPIPAEAGVSVLITTRLRGVRGALEVEVTALDAEAARDLLVERSGRRRLSSEEETAALDLADRVLGGHPLALSLAGAYLRETGAGFSIASYRDKVARVGTMTALEEAASRAGYQVDDYERSILETYRLSRGLLLPTNSIDARALRLLSIASCLAANVPIDRRLLRRALADEGAADDEEVGLSTERLLKLSLLSPSRDEQSEEGDVIIHPLVADYTRVAIGEEEQKRVELAVVTTMTRLLPDHYMAMWKIAQKAHGDWEWLTSFREAHVDAVWRRSERYPTRWVGRLGAALGDLRVARGNLTSAREAFECSLAVREHLALQDAENAEWQRDLLVSHNRIGDVLMAQGQREEALSAYRAGLAIIECLAAQDAGNAQWQRDLSVSYDDIGDVLMAQRQKEEALSADRAGLAIRERLAAQDAENAEWQRDLSVSYNKIADVFMVQGHRKEALWAYRVSLAIMERLVAQDAGNAQWQRDLSVGQNRIGDVLMARGQREEALSAYRAGLAISERLASQDAGNAQWQSDLAASCFRMGDALAGSSSDTCMEARTWLKRARRILMDLHATSRLAYQEQQWLLFIEQKLATLPP
jgi:predicted negative regulator of RcsB-dependent stress response